MDLVIILRMFLAIGLKKHFLNAVIIIVITQLLSIEGLDECPRGFQEVKYSKLGEASIKRYCYLEKKNPEPLSDKFVNCNGNLFSYELYKKLDLPKSRHRIWTDYKSLYNGSVFIDWSYTNTTGNLLNTSLDVYREGDVNIDEKMCVVLDPERNFTMMSCSGRHYRYCIVERGSGSRELEHVKLTVTVEYRTKIKLFVKYTKPRDTGDRRLLKDNIMCFTDSLLYRPETEKIKLVSNESSEFDVYELTRKDQGYYWCTHKDPYFHKTDSNSALYVDELSAMNVYAVRIKSNESYPLDDRVIDEMLDSLWITKLIEYMKYSKEYNESNITEAYDNMTISNFKRSHPIDIDLTELDIIEKKVKRPYLDGKTALLHVEVDIPLPVRPGRWGQMFLEYMKPAYYCDKEKKFKLGDNYTKSDCTFYKCDGNYYDGVETITYKLGTDECTPQNRLDIAIDEITEFLNSSKPVTTSDADNMLKKTGDLLAQVIARMKEFLNSSNPITMKDIENIFNKVDVILSLGELDIKGNFLRLLDDIGARMDLNGSNHASSVQKNIALVVADAQPNSRVKGLQVLATGSEFINSSFAIISENNTQRSDVSSELVVLLPDSVSSTKRRISFVIFRDHTAFQGRQDRITVNSRILSINVENITNFSPGETIDIQMKPVYQTNRNQNRTCAFWKYNADDTGSWSQEGCNFTSASQEGLLDICRCNHLTHFAEILVRTGFSEEVEITLERLSVIGCCISILGLLLVGLTAVLFHSWRRDFSNKIWLNLCTSILILSVCFLVVVFARFQESNIFCVLTGIAVHYSVLSSFCWMLVAAVISYRKLVLVFSQDPSHKLLRASVFAWGTPCVIVGILLLVARHSYGQYDVKNPNGTFCYPTGLALWLAVYAPISLILLSNTILFILIFRSAFGKNQLKKNKTKNAVKEAFRCASISFLLVFLFGLPWLFGFFSSNVVFAFLFTILVTFQGFILFFLFVGNKKSRELWFVKLKIKKATIPGMISTDRSNVPLTNVEGNRLKKNSTQPLLPNGSS